MATIAPPTPPAFPQPQIDPDALIKEARERRRRRRQRIALVLVAVAAACACLAYGFARLGGGGVGTQHVRGGPVVNVGAFRGHGRLAFVSHRVLWVLDGEHGKLRRLPSSGGFVPTQPAFSRDGRWMAYLAQRIDPNTGTARARLWLAHGDGTDPRVIGDVSPYDLYGWSPRNDTLAVAAGPEQTRRPCPCYSPTTLRLVTPNGSSRVLARGPWINGAAWSPDGREIAVAVEGPLERSVIATYPVAGGARTVWLRFARHVPLNGMTQILTSVAGWWRGVGIGFWAVGNGMVRNLDQTPLDVVAAPNARPRLLAQTLSDGTTTAVAAAARGVAVAVVADVSRGYEGGREIWSEKQVQVCPPAAPCRGLVSRASKVTLDPAWSADGRTLAFVEAPALRDAAWPQQRLHRWYAEHMLALYDARSGHVTTLPRARGATVPAWAPDGKSLLYVSGDGLWLLPSLTGRPVEIATPLFPPNNWPAYYGQIAWAAQFAWWAK